MRLSMPTALTIFVILCWLCFEYYLSQKNWQKLFFLLTMCYKKSFLSYSIFNLRLLSDSSGSPSKSELAYYSISKFTLSSKIHSFFKNFSRFFYPRKFLLFPFRPRTACLFYHNDFGKSTVFRNFFAFFALFFEKNLPPQGVVFLLRLWYNI